MSGPLAGLRVVEIADELGQYAGKLLADMGADVVKIEPPEGSEARRVGPFVNDEPGPNRSLNFWYHNTNKRSLVLDLDHSEADRDTARALLARADIFLEALPPGHAASLGLDYATLAAARTAATVSGPSRSISDSRDAAMRSANASSLSPSWPSRQ